MSPSSPETEAGRRLLGDLSRRGWGRGPYDVATMQVRAIEAQARRDALLALRAVVEEIGNRPRSGEPYLALAQSFDEIRAAIDHQLGEGT